MRIRFSVAQEANRLHMNSFAELIYAACLFKFVSCCEECRKIACEAGGFAGDVDDVVYAVGENLRQSLWMDTVSWWVEDDYIWFLGEVIEDFEDVSGYEFAVG